MPRPSKKLPDFSLMGITQAHAQKLMNDFHGVFDVLEESRAHKHASREMEPLVPEGTMKLLGNLQYNPRFLELISIIKKIAEGTSKDNYRQDMVLADASAILYAQAKSSTISTALQEAALEAKENREAFEKEIEEQRITTNQARISHKVMVDFLGAAWNLAQELHLPGKSPGSPG